jgi:hypothetical protein
VLFTLLTGALGHTRDADGADLLVIGEHLCVCLSVSVCVSAKCVHVFFALSSLFSALFFLAMSHLVAPLEGAATRFQGLVTSGVG